MPASSGTREDRIEVALKLLGQKEFERGIQDAAKAEYDLAKATNRHSEELRANARLTEVAQRQAQRQAEAFRALAQQATLAGSATKTANDNVGGFTQAAKGSSIVLGQFANSLTGMLPGLNGVGAAVVRASSAIGGMSQVLGTGAAGGPAGLIAGGLIAAVGIASVAIKAFGDETEVASSVMGDMNRTIEEQIALLTKLDQAANLRAAVSQGLAGPEAQFAEVKRLEHERDVIRARLAQISTGGVVTREFRNLQAQDVANARALATARANRALSLQEDADIAQQDAEFEAADKRQKEREARLKRAANEKTRGIAVNFGDALSPGEEGRNQIAQVISLEEEKLRRLKRVREFAERESKVSGAGEAARDQAEKQGEAEIAAAERIRTAKDTELQQDLKRWEARNKAAAEHHKLLQDAAHEAWTMVGNSAASALAAMAAGQKVVLKEVLRALGAQMVQAGVMKVFEGAFQSLILNPAGPEMVAIGLAESAAGAALAGAAGASGGASAGGGRSGSNVARVAAKPNIEAPSTETGAREQPYTVVNNKIYMSSVVAPGVQDARRIEQAQAEKRRKGR